MILFYVKIGYMKMLLFYGKIGYTNAIILWWNWIHTNAIILWGYKVLIQSKQWRVYQKAEGSIYKYYYFMRVWSLDTMKSLPVGSSRLSRMRTSLSYPLLPGMLKLLLSPITDVKKGLLKKLIFQWTELFCITVKLNRQPAFF